MRIEAVPLPIHEEGGPDEQCIFVNHIEHEDDHPCFKWKVCEPIIIGNDFPRTVSDDEQRNSHRLNGKRVYWNQAKLDADTEAGLVGRSHVSELVTALEASRLVCNSSIDRSVVCINVINHTVESENLGTGAGGDVPDSAYRASSGCPGNEPWKARLGDGTYWKPAESDYAPWIELDISDNQGVDGVWVQGNGPNFLKKFLLFFSDDGAEWTASHKEYLAPESLTIGDKAEYYQVAPHGHGRYMKIVPREWEGELNLAFDVSMSIEKGAESRHPNILLLPAGDIHYSKELETVLGDRPIDTMIFQFDMPKLILHTLKRNKKLKYYSVMDSINEDGMSQILINAPGFLNEEVNGIISNFDVGFTVGSYSGWVPNLRESAYLNAMPEDELLMHVEAGRSTMLTEVLAKNIEEGGKMSFDYLMFVIVASMIAAGGLAFNSTVSVVASMLVSPIMGPVMSMTFGAVIGNWRMFWNGMFSEFMSIMMCILLGFLWACPMMYITDVGPGMYYQWPTGEMSGRGAINVLGEGFAIALPSGVGVALGIMGCASTDLVGVAISASLLPPAVNCGMLLAFALLWNMDSAHRGVIATKALISLGLTIENIVIIWFVAYGIFKLKEAMPKEYGGQFWSELVDESDSDVGEGETLASRKRAKEIKQRQIDSQKKTR